MVHNCPVKTLTHRGITVEGYLRRRADLLAIPNLSWASISGHIRGASWPRPIYSSRYALRPCGGATGLRCAAADDEDGAADDLLARASGRERRSHPQALHALDRGRLPCQLIGLKPGDEIEMSREHVVTVSATAHRVPSLGFVVWERRRKLRPEFQDLPGDKIRDLRLAGTDVTEERRMPRVAYIGDRPPRGWTIVRPCSRPQILITEMTFVAARHRKEKIHKFGHMHLDDILGAASDSRTRSSSPRTSARVTTRSKSGNMSKRPCPTCSKAVCTCGCRRVAVPNSVGCVSDARS